MAAVKLTGDPSCVGNSTDEDLETGELDLESRDSLQLLALLTGVLTRLSGVLVDQVSWWSPKKSLGSSGSSLWSYSQRG